MVEVTLTIYSLEDTRELPLTGDRLSVGRSTAADLMLNDEGLSRVHATIHREDDRVWILDEASTNGTCVNDVLVPPTGSPLSDGDEISLGNHTTILINIRSMAVIQPEFSGNRPKANISWPSPLLAASGGVVVVLLAAVVIGVFATRNTNKNSNTVSPRVTRSPTSTPARNESNNTATVAPAVSPSPAVSPAVETSVPVPANPPVVVKDYRSMTQQERFDYVAQEAQQVARVIGNRDGFNFPPEVVSRIKAFVDTYSGRLHRAPPPPAASCNMRHDLRTLLTRGSKHAPLIGKHFYDKGLKPQVGIYLAMIESEYCPCLSSGTGAKGMFQFVGTTARRFGVQDVSRPSTDPRFDDRCKVEIMAPLAAQYMKELVAMFGTGSVGVPLAVASYNSGEGGLNKNLLNTLFSVSGSERSFWALIANSSHLSPQFQRENINYVPKFFAAAIVGENPRIFGVDMNPLSTYTVSGGSAAAPTP